MKMNILYKIQEIDDIIIEIVKRFENLKTYSPTSFNNIQYKNKTFLYKKINDIDIWLINSFSEKEYDEHINYYLKTNTTKHGRLVYEAFLKNKNLYLNEYFKIEKDIILNKSGLLFIQTYFDDENNIKKRCFFYEYDFENK